MADRVMTADICAGHRKTRARRARRCDARTARGDRAAVVLYLRPGSAIRFTGREGRSMTELLRNHLCGRWVAGTGDGTTLRDPISGAALVRVSGQGVDLASAVAYARDVGGAALRALGYGPRAAMLGSIAKALTANRDAYFEIATANSGTTRADSAMDIDGAIYTVSQYARWGAALGEARALSDGSRARLGKDGSFQSQHVLVPTRGVALLINAFNFPAWGLWEKAAPALLSGVPVLVK